MISYNEATEIVLAAVPAPRHRRLPLQQAKDHVLTEDMVSPINVSSFRNSAMDGFAVCAGILEDCSSENPVSLPIGTTVFAGEDSSGNCQRDHAVKVMTGAPVPEIYDAVVKFEDTKHDSTNVSFTKPVAAGENVRQPGEDIARGQKLYSAGDILGTFDAGILASMGLKEVPVCDKPFALIVSTGNELVEPGEELQDGKIYDSNKYTIASIMQRFCQDVETVSAVDDRVDSLKSVLQSEHDIIVASGGVSAGERDLLVGAAEASGWKTLFHKVAIKPGKPVYFAKREKQLLFGLPGNPLSAAVTCTVFILPALKKMTGRKKFRLSVFPARLSSQPARKSNRTIIWPGRIWQESSETLATFSTKESSAALSALLGSDGLIFQKSININGAGSDRVEVVTWHQAFN